jgi:hypothetical protein
MTLPTQRLTADSGLIINGVAYELDEDPKSPAVQRQTVPTQPGDPGVEFERRITNLALGWGNSKFTQAGTYDYGATANLHRRLAWLPGTTITDRTTGSPIGEVSFCEYWDGTAANRRLLIISPRKVFEVGSSGTITTNDLGSGFTRANGMQWGVNFRTGGMSAPKVFISRNGSTSTDYMVRRTAANTYTVGTANTKFAMAIAKGKDSAGADVLWRANENGKLNQSVADSDPNVDGSWSGASYPSSLYPLGDTSTRVNSLTQQNRSMVAGKPDGAWTFDNQLWTIPIVDMRQTPDDDNFKWFKDWNGSAIAPTVQGLVMIDGLEWRPFGPVSTNDNARNLRGRETAVSGPAGNYTYCSVYSGAISYIFVGTPRKQGDTGTGPLTWHGPIASIAKKVVDLCVSTVVPTARLWIGYADTGSPPSTGGWASMELQTDFSPLTDASSGTIYLPEGILDMEGPGVIKDLRKAEFIAPASTPFSATNSWSVGVDLTGSGSYTAIDGGNVTSGVTADRYWSTETSGKRPRIVITYTNNSSNNAELEAVVIRGTVRPETTEEWVFRIRLRDQQRSPQGRHQPVGAVTALAALRALVDSGRTTSIVYGEASFTAKILNVKDTASRQAQGPSPVRVVEVSVRRVKTA